MKVLVVTGYYKPAYVYGGPVKSVSDLCEGMARAGAEVSVFTTDANGIGQHLQLERGREQRLEGVRVRYYPVEWPLARVAPYYSPGLAAACREEVGAYDVAYLPSTWTHAMWAGAQASKGAGVPYVVSPRGSFMNWSLKQKALKKKVYLLLFERRFVEGAAALHVTTELEARQQKKLGFRTPVVVIPNGIDLSRFRIAESGQDTRLALGLPRDATLSLFVGRLHPIKRVDVIIDAFAQVARLAPNAHLVLVGPDYGSESQLRRQTAELGLTSKVHFLGLVQGGKLTQIYRCADLLLLVSHRENFGMVLLEAMTCGLPVIVSDQVGLAEEIDQAGAGLVVTGGSEVLVSPWLRLLGDQVFRRQMGERGRALVLARFDVERVSNEMLRLFERIQSSKSYSADLSTV